MAYIDKDKVLEICEEHYQHCLEMHDWSGDTTADNIKEDIEKLPTADVQEVKHGEWLDNHNGTFVCSVCRGKSPRKRWCGDCGAKMEGGKAE